MGFALKNLNESERKGIAEGLFVVKSEDAGKGELHGLCPIHDESNPSFSYNYKTDTYNCFSCGASGDLIKLWSAIKGYDAKEGFKAFCLEFSIKTDVPDQTSVKTKKTDGFDLTAVFQNMAPLPQLWRARLSVAREWSEKTIESLDIRLQTHYRDKKGKIRKIDKPERIAIPVRDTAGVVRNIRLYKPGR